MKTVIGIDPGKTIGCAELIDNKVVSLCSFKSSRSNDYLIEYIELNLDRIELVVMEDSRLQTKIFPRQVGPLQMQRIARNVGHVDAQCAALAEAIQKLGVCYLAIAPSAKGGKLDREGFARHYGWHGPSNQHERDAALIARMGARMMGEKKPA